MEMLFKSNFYVVVSILLLYSLNNGNYDGRFSPFDINAAAARRGDMSHPEPFRRYAHYWLIGDDMRAGRNARFANRDERSNLSRQIAQ